MQCILNFKLMITSATKTFIVIGSTGGIGSAITKNLLHENHRVVGFGRKLETFNQHKLYEHIFCDLEKLDLVEAKAKELSKVHKKIDGLILTAGFGKFSELEQFSVEQMQTVLNVNFLSQAILTKMLLPNLKKTQNSKIIAIGSEASLQGARKGSLYCAAKFALRGFLQSLRMECVQSRTAVTLLNPGFVNTQFFSELSFRPGKDYDNSIVPDQIAKTVAIILEMENNCIIEEVNLQPLKKVIQKIKK